MSLLSSRARAVIAAAETASSKLGVPVIVAVVDAGTNLKAFTRMDGAVLGSIDLAMKKARTAALFEANSEVVWEYCKPGAPAHGLELSEWRPGAVRRRRPSEGCHRPDDRRRRRLGRHRRAGLRDRPASPRRRIQLTERRVPCPRRSSSPAPAPDWAKAPPSAWPGTATTSSPRHRYRHRWRQLRRKRRSSISAIFASRSSTCSIPTTSPARTRGTSTCCSTTRASARAGPVSEIPVDLVRRNFEVNVNAPLALTQGFIRKWIEQKKPGKIVFTSSMGGLFTPPGLRRLRLDQARARGAGRSHAAGAEAVRHQGPDHQSGRLPHRLQRDDGGHAVPVARRCEELHQARRRCAPRSTACWGRRKGDSTRRR